MLAGLSADLLRQGWDQVGVMMGKFESMSEPVVRRLDEHTVVDIPMEFREGPMKGRIAVDADGQVAGVFILNLDVHKTSRRQVCPGRFRAWRTN